MSDVFAGILMAWYLNKRKKKQKKKKEARGYRAQQEHTKSDNHTSSNHGRQPL